MAYCLCIVVHSVWGNTVRIYIYIYIYTEKIETDNETKAEMALASFSRHIGDSIAYHKDNDTLNYTQRFQSIS